MGIDKLLKNLFSVNKTKTIRNNMTKKTIGFPADEVNKKQTKKTEDKKDNTKIVKSSSSKSTSKTRWTRPKTKEEIAFDKSAVEYISNNKPLSIEQLYEKYSVFENCFAHVDVIFHDFAELTEHKNNQIMRHVFIPPRNTDVNPVLVVAHLDTVIMPEIREFDDEINVWYGAGFDDRTGLHLAIRSHMESDNVALLLTDNEEIGGSTASFMESKFDLDYLALIEYDRAESDVVTYDMESPEWIDLLEMMGRSIGYGSFSDIANLKHLDICAVNIGVGCINSHQRDSYQSKIVMESSFAYGMNLVNFLVQSQFQYLIAPKPKYEHGRTYGKSWTDYKLPETGKKVESKDDDIEAKLDGVKQKEDLSYGDYGYPWWEEEGFESEDAYYDYYEGYHGNVYAIDSDKEENKDFFDEVQDSQKMIED